ncbi:MAG: CDP-alcohol phosphatidyltransferase family protein [Clostridia bacterium]|nr:CDP-alcohol phosphatidyltransferase family protein [Clostridia bacterium]
MKELFKGCWTIPNLLSLIRILLVPVFLVLFFQGNKIGALIVLALSGVSDFLDGKIARHFNQISALGKLLDPVADKITQLSIAVVLFWQFNSSSVISLKYFSYVFLAFLGKELLMLVCGSIMVAVGLRPCAAEIYGKIATFTFYVVMIFVICFGPEVGALIEWYVMPNWLVMTLVLISLVLTIIALISYIPDTWRQVKEKKQQKGGSK